MLPPNMCPVSGDALEREPDAVDLYCPNALCPERIFQSVKFFASRGGMNIDGLGPQTLRLLIAHKLIADEADLFSLDPQELQALEGIGEKKATQILAALQDAKSRPLPQLLTSLGIPGLGETMARLIIGATPQLDALATMAERVQDAKAEAVALVPALSAMFETLVLGNAKVVDPRKRLLRLLESEFAAMPETHHELLQHQFAQALEAIKPLLEIDGVGPSLVQAIIAWFSDARNRRIVEKMRAAGLVLAEKPQADERKTLAGLTFVITGKLSGWSRKGARQFIEDHGGRVTASVSRKTRYLVAGKGGGSKRAKAAALDVPVLDEAALRALANDGKP